MKKTLSDDTIYRSPPPGFAALTDLSGRVLLIRLESISLVMAPSDHQKATMPDIGASVIVSGPHDHYAVKETLAEISVKLGGVNSYDNRD